MVLYGQICSFFLYPSTHILVATLTDRAGCTLSAVYVPDRIYLQIDCHSKSGDTAEILAGQSQR